jgi:hypothetical protein
MRLMNDGKIQYNGHRNRQKPAQQQLKPKIACFPIGRPLQQLPQRGSVKNQEEQGMYKCSARDNRKVEHRPKFS